MNINLTPTQKPNTYTHPEVLVENQWLLEHLHDSNIRVIEAGMSPEPYYEAHIPGAVFWHFTDLFNPGFRLKLEPDAIAALLSRSGIAPQTTVITYGKYPGIGALLFWFLRLFGHQNVRVLNGGRQKWLAENQPVSQEVPTLTPTDYPTPSIDSNLRVLTQEVLAGIDRPDRVLLDVRSDAEYSGKLFLDQPPTGTERAGHIPGAIHLENLLTLNPDGTFKSFNQLQALFEQKGMSADQEIFTYCAFGGRSAHVWFVLKYLLGYAKVRNYDGSWNEWSRSPNTPVQR
ncbi:Rhodanese-like protein (plasmid) [Thalassoporum mexicanum PCC 7367]|uniref:sulfurtransferase n=1 Tax=Thalassoporum mexicanum TaxID=3457544 RepID=UPI00029FA396|nr:sulfurtransferase [Pseudanabaena sp. PCC 7367]AFY71906.1 Rhodanese-like protein [Pseudanabaena sp. PCC 7367]